MSQKIGAIDGLDAFGIGTNIPIFQLQEVVFGNKKIGLLKINYSENLIPTGLEVANVPAELYFVTIRIQDAGLAYEDVIFEIDMRVQLDGGEYDPDAAFSGNIFNCALQIDFSLLGGFNSFFRTSCGLSLPNLWSGHSWTFFSANVLRIDAGRPGVIASEVGYYLYAGGTFANDIEAVESTSTSIAASRSLLEYSGLDNLQQGLSLIHI